MVNCIRVKKATLFNLNEMYAVEVSVDKQRWSKGVTCTASIFNVAVTHFPVSVVRYIRVSPMIDTCEIRAITIMCQKLNCTCPTGEKNH